MENQIMVSVYCLAYNHAKYIRQTLEGFVNQKTNFRYEVIVHDDASKDGTQNIIKEYAEKYPEIFVPILQKENQFSKKINLLSTYIYPEIRGKYVALCEGDDYWTDLYKLQKQVDILESHPECIISTHKVGRIKEDGEVLEGSFPAKNLNIVPGILKQNIFMKYLIVKGYLFHTSSYMYRKELLDIYVEKKPGFISLFSGDYATLCLAASHGSCFFMREEMSKYRVMSQGSWTSRISKDRKAQMLRYEKSIRGLKSLDEYTEYKYRDIISDAVRRQTAILYSVQGKYRYLLKNMKYINLRKEKIKCFLLGIVDTVFPDMIYKFKLR